MHHVKYAFQYEPLYIIHTKSRGGYLDQNPLQFNYVYYFEIHFKTTNYPVMSLKKIRIAMFTVRTSFLQCLSKCNDGDRNVFIHVLINK